MTAPDPRPAQPPTLDEMTGEFARIALSAGELILTIYGRDFSVQTKADDTPLTEADTAAEALIMDRLAALFPNIPVVAEEAVANGLKPVLADRFILVDPLDGSKEFIARNGEFTVNIALIEHGVPVAGVVYAPALGRIWWGSRTNGAFAARVENHAIIETVPVKVRVAPKSGLMAIGSRSHGSGQADTRLDALEITDFATAGSSLKFCLLAEGAADLYPRFGRTMEWDTAAGDAILRAAGGHVIDMAGQPLRYGKCNQSADSDFANCAFWAIGDGAIIRKVCGDATAVESQ
ncbi:3'(2'),5'-bisphosphate nucleotidase CysQ [Pelagibacterium sp. 26DY04]|uniref:3'(2'),5'-bisphosphate nucleotidase CysQ n=1 Tax=Pelagibacterium sp. 26DY04 TaxID=2967130 RepID=UPI002815B660|nr:3'(2'),5'-bisphosphate nucleotidase CysQ [Pelagibacterium sp. 26DY04]WMT86747.1 3'(2'),5'-bisphosphate nucleotidase CysQ [Pelagibacterium sp. 26DY04]